MNNYRYITVITNTRYLPGVYTLNYTLRRVGNKYPLSVLIPKNDNSEIKEKLVARGIDVIEMEWVVPREEVLQHNSIFYWTDTLFKLNIFRLIQFDKIVYLDADMIILNPIDELFDVPHLSAVIAGKCLHPEWNGLNGGMMVIKPALDEYEGLVKMLPQTICNCQKQGKGFGDQDVINDYYSQWSNWTELHLSEIYNAMFGFGKESYFKAISKLEKKSIEEFKILHFIGYFKPWNYPIHHLVPYLFRLLIKGNYLEYKAWRIYRKYVKAATYNR